MCEEIIDRDLKTKVCDAMDKGTPLERAYRQCFHKPDWEVLEEAENVIVLLEPVGPRSLPLIHVWVYTDSPWSSCTTFSPSVWSKLPMPDQMAILQEKLRFLKTLTP